jgi:hypothetical protein
MGAFGGGLQFVEKRVHLYQRKALRNERNQNFLNLMAKFSKHGDVMTALELPPHSPQLESKKLLGNIQLGDEFSPLRIPTEDLKDVVLEFGAVSEFPFGRVDARRYRS